MISRVVVSSSSFSYSRLLLVVLFCCGALLHGFLHIFLLFLDHDNMVLTRWDSEPQFVQNRIHKQPKTGKTPTIRTRMRTTTPTTQTTAMAKGTTTTTTTTMTTMTMMMMAAGSAGALAFVRIPQILCRFVRGRKTPRKTRKQ